MDYLKKDGETFLDWKLRLIVGKIDKTIDLDWVEIKDLLQLECSPDHLRKTAYGIYEYSNYIQEKKEEKVTTNDVLGELDLKKRELEKEKIKFQDQRREYKKLLTIDSRFEHLLNKIDDATLEISQSKPLIVTQSCGGGGVNEGVLLISDWHSELEVDNFLNKFNKEEFLRRVNKLVDKTIQHGIAHDISKLHVFNLGDLLSGVIHNNVRVANNELTVSQTMFIAELLSEILCRFASKFKSVVFYQVLDNHSRVFASKEDSIAGESFARFIPWYMQPRLKEFNNIEINTDALDGEIMVAEICGKKIFAVHGHCDKLSSVVGDLTMMIRQIPDYIFVSHWHHNVEDEIHSCEVIVNQSLIGSDDYSKNIRKTSKPAQKFMVFNSEDGRECTYSIKLSK
jgi:hypothetical protein